VSNGASYDYIWGYCCWSEKRENFRYSFKEFLPTEAVLPNNELRLFLIPALAEKFYIT